MITLGLAPIRTITRTSICDCGHPALSNDVNVGDKFVCLMRLNGTFTCARCGWKSKQKVILAKNLKGDEGYIPELCFEPATQTVTE